MKRKILFLIFFCFLSSIAFSQEENILKIRKEYTDDGINIIPKESSKHLKIYYSLYNEYYKTKAKGKVRRNKLFVPYDTEVCMWGKDKKGNKTEVKYFVAKKANEENIMEVISPQSGSWNEKQMLIIHANDKTQIMYSVNGNNPEKFGLLYTEPILIEEKGDIALWIKAISEDGTISEKKIKYSVKKDGAKTPKRIIKEDTDFYRQLKDEPFKILSWHFVQFTFDETIKYSIKENLVEDLNTVRLSNTYKEPIFLERNKDAVIYWSSPTYNDGKTNKIELPKKPILAKIPNKIENKAIELKFDDPRYRYFCVKENTPQYFYSFASLKNLDELDIETLNLKEFENKKFLCDIQAKQEKEFNIKIPVFYKGIYQGSFSKKLRIDKLAPNTPDVNFYPAFSPTNIPVIISASSKDGKIITEIIPPIFYKTDDKKIILCGLEDRPVSYSVNIYAIDKAGNKSLSIKRKITVDKNAIFVDSSSASKNPNGNPSNPYSHPDQALEFINEYTLKNPDSINEKWKIYLRGNFILNEALLISKNVRFIATGKRANIRFTKNTGFVVNNSYFELENCNVFRREYAGEPRSVPIIYTANSTIKLSNVNLKAIEGQSVLNAFSSHLDISNTKVISKQTNHCTMFNLDNCSAVFENINFNGSGNSILAISISNSNIELDDIKSSLKTNFTARFLQSWNSQILIGKINSLRLPENEKNKDCAIWYNRNSKIDIKFKPIVRGYSKAIQREQ